MKSGNPLLSLFMRAVPSEDYVERCVSENFQKSVSTFLRFLHRRAAGNTGPLTGGNAGMIHMGDRRLLILVRSNFKKFPKEVSKKLDSGH